MRLSGRKVMSKYFWLKDVRGLVIILAFISVPTFFISLFFRFSLIVTPLLIGGIAAFIRKCAWDWWSKNAT